MRLMASENEAIISVCPFSTDSEDTIIESVLVPIIANT